MRAILFALVASAFCAIGAAYAVQPNEVLPDPKLEARARALSADLRCMVCQNQSIDDSDATLAHDIRVLIRERLAKGESEEAIKAFLVSRYGDFVLLRPPLKPETLLLWGGPPIILVVGTAFLVLSIRGKARRDPKPAPLSSAEEQRLADLLGRPKI